MYCINQSIAIFAVSITTKTNTMVTTIIYVKGGVRNTVSYINKNETEALAQFKKDFGNCKILFKQTA